MKIFRYLIMMFISITLITSVYASKKRQPMQVFINFSGLDENAKAKTKQMEQLTNFIKQDLKRKLKKLYDVSFVTDPSATTPENGLFMVYNIIKYNPGSTAARYLVGFGAGSCSLDIKYEILQDNNSILLKEDGCGSSRGWRKCVVKLNKNIQKNLKTQLK